LFPDCAKSRPYGIRIRIKWLTKLFRTEEIYPDTDTDDKNSPNAILLVPFFIRIRNADTDTDTEKWNRGLKRIAPSLERLNFSLRTTINYTTNSCLHTYIFKMSSHSLCFLTSEYSDLIPILTS